MSEALTTSMLDRALALAAEEFSVMPLQPGAKTPILPGWPDLADKPLDEAQLRRCWEKHPGANIGIVTGAGLVVIDVDVKAGKTGKADMQKIAEDLGLPRDWLDTFIVGTPSGGLHLYFTIPVDIGCPPLTDSIDIRGRGGQVVAPGSVVGGKVYSVTRDRPIKEIPPALLERLLGDGGARGGAGPRGRHIEPLVLLDTDEGLEAAIEYLKTTAPAIQGKQGDKRTRDVALWVGDFGVSETRCLELMAEHYNPRCEPPWDLDGDLGGSGGQTLDDKVRSAYAGRENPLGCKHPSVVNRGFAGTNIPPIDTPPGGVPVTGLRGERPKPIESSMTNVVAALGSTEGLKLRFDEFRGDLVYRDQGGPWTPFSDAFVTELRMRLEGVGFHKPGKEIVREAAGWIGDRNRIDTAKEWAASLTWDGVPRIDRFFADYLGAEDTKYAQACGAYLFTALAGRLLVPGVQADLALILVGPQGAYKSSVVKALAPLERSYATLSFDKKEEERARLMRGKLVCELEELKGLRKSELEATKAWITRCEEEWTPKYMEFVTTYRRRAVLIGTTNDSDFLADPTGARRFLPIRVTQCDVDLIKHDRDQLWAEGIARFKAKGVQWQEAQRLAQAEHEGYETEDTWRDIIGTWLKDNCQGGRVTLRDVLTRALGMPLSHIKPNDEKRGADALRKLGWVSRQSRVDGKKFRYWEPGPA
jgi:hypothetical protein